MSMPDFEYLEPRSVAEACAMLAEDPEGRVVFAGGTDVLVDLKSGGRAPRALVSLGRVAGLDGLEVDTRGDLVIGAMTKINRVARGEGGAALFPGIVEAARSVAAEQVRNSATVAGNLCTAVPSADMAPILLAWDARLRVTSPEGERLLALRELFVGPRQTVLGPADIVTAIEVPARAGQTGDASLRQGGRVSLSLPLAGVAVVLTLDDGRCTGADVALGAVAPTPALAPAAADRLVGSELDATTVAEAARIAAGEARPISDLRAGAAYRRELVEVLTQRVVARAAERARGGK